MKKKKHIRLLLVEDNAVNAKLTEVMLSRVEDQTFEIQGAASLLEGLNLIATNVFDVALVDLTLPDSQGLETFRTIQRHAHNLPIIVLTGVEDDSVALTAVQQGAQDFLQKGAVNKESLIKALNYAIARSQNPSESATPAQGKATVLGFIGTNGGVGTTTLAAHCAMELANDDERVLLMDLDVSSAGASFLMKATSQRTLLDAAENLHRLDANLWKGIVSTPYKGVDLLQAPGAIGVSSVPAAERIRHIVRFARSLYTWIVVDVGRLTSTSLAILEETKDLFVVTTPHLSSLFETGRLVQRLLDTGVPTEKIRLLLNRRSKSMAISVEQVEKALGYTFYASIGDATSEITDAYAEGRFLDEDLPVRKQMGQVMRRVRGIEEKPASRSAFGFLRLSRSTAGD